MCGVLVCGGVGVRAGGGVRFLRGVCVCGVRESGGVGVGVIGVCMVCVVDVRVGVCVCGVVWVLRGVMFSGGVIGCDGFWVCGGLVCVLLSCIVGWEVLVGLT